MFFERFWSLRQGGNVFLDFFLMKRNTTLFSFDQVKNPFAHLKKISFRIFILVSVL